MGRSKGYSVTLCFPVHADDESTPPPSLSFDSLGIIKEMQPQYVATFSEKPQVLEGHPFVVEAGVSLGGAEVSTAMVRMESCRCASVRIGVHQGFEAP